MTLTNTGTTSLVLPSVTTNGDFALTPGTTCANGDTLVAAASCTINVIFAPVGTGTINSQLAITDDGGASPQIVPLTGKGT